MFTGLIQAIATISQRTDHYLDIQIGENDRQILLEIALGDSIAINGVCLTVAEILPSGFRADISPETYIKTNLGITQMNYVNLEMSLKVGDRLGGHFVSGHVDGLGTVCQISQSPNAWEFSFQTDCPTGKYLVYKGSVAVNGISLTVAQSEDSLESTQFTVAVIPHTYANTNLRWLKIGDRVNIETDMLGKYVERFINYPHQKTSSVTAVTKDFLKVHGWL